ncbi:MAG: hypothetical protein K8F53_04780, partial [Rhodocyclaceae bacterium]|nr:hypothetical protein [Rhodocyclaceae bacterium]
MVSLRRAALLLGAALCFAAGCALQETIGGSREGVTAWAAARGFRAETVSAEGFDLYSLLRRRAAAAQLTVYIEGDGAPWPDSRR